ncbi:Gfo/Idh/MocA family oxidoreductase [Iamia majanohamensis]|uniref:Gfo/Idh/MocA family oxidoreductase n=1 Tax=Iamia majanohamensis TaxID=467976 RepID=A0AAE9Y3G7_9ACTN|nr:Gfo/Idh/MocA family oxidoreductase [Iamia majanohamensis]WCO65085.1 Gfo/Idh/MocA family oxidoreductase [Iamia majanohamensis]
MTVRVGFLGAGLIATFHSKMLRASGEDVAWAGVWDPDEERRDRFAAASGATPARSEEEVLATCDAAYVCTWTSEHPRLVEAAVARGLPVFVEKPLATDLAGARAVADVVARAGVTNQVGLILRRAPVFTLLRALVAEAGPVMAVVFRDDQFLPVQGSYGSTWRGDRERAGSGALLEHSIHDLDLLEHVVGPVASVSARSAHFHGLDGIEDVVTASLALAGGGVASLTSVWHDVLSRPSLRRLEVFCTDRWFATDDDWFGPLTWQAPDGPAVTLAPDQVQDELARRGLASPNPDGDFVRAVAEGRPAWPDVHVAVRAHELVDATYRSAAAAGAPVATAGA